MAFFQEQFEKRSDERLMELIVRGDERAFGTLYDRYSGRLLNYFHRMLWKDRERAEDLTQDLFMKLAKKPGSYDPNRPFSTWLFSIANNMCKNEYRREEVRRRPAPDMIIHTADPGLAPLKNLDHERFRGRLEGELAQLDPDQRSTFVMRHFEDMAIKEIAEIMGCSEGTVKSRLFYTLKKLAGKLEEFSPQSTTGNGT